MKRSNQLIVESAVIGALLLGILFAGSLSTSYLPQSWIKIQNPNAVQPEYNLTSIAIFYNDTLTSLSEYQYQSVSSSLGVFHFLVIPLSLNATALAANNEIASMNQSLPAAQYYLNQTQLYYRNGFFTNASLALNSFCEAISNASASLAQFVGPTISAFAKDNITVQLFERPTLVLGNEITSYSNQCKSYKSMLNRSSSTTSLTISSNQTPLAPYGNMWIYTGGELNITATLEQNGSAVGGQIVAFHIEGHSTSPANLTTVGGSVTGTLTIPFLYVSNVSVWATVGSNSTSGLSPAVSNTLSFTLIYNQTKIIINDPPSILPTFPYIVSGILRDDSTGTPLPDAPVRITSFNSSFFTTTNTSGYFTYDLTVPPNATDGLHYIDAAFAPQGAYGPSVNFTSIIVYHLPLNISLNTPSVVFPGFPASIGGQVMANGTALSNSKILLDTPWGIYNTTTDSNGRFGVPFSVPITEFAFSKQVTVKVLPIEPYVTSSLAGANLNLLNLIFLAVIVCMTGFGAYQARNLGAHLPSLRRREEEAIEVFESVGNATESAEKSRIAVPSEIGIFRSPFVSIYIDALSLAAKKFGIKFVSSLTIRETIDIVSKADKKASGTALFREIALRAESYLYSRKFLEQGNAQAWKGQDETGTIRQSFQKLEALWSVKGHEKNE